MNCYFKVHHGPVYNILKNHLDSHKAANDGLVEWAKKHDLPIQGSNGTTIYFKDGFKPDPASWRKSGSRGGFSPRQKSESGKVLYAELEALPKYPSWMTLILELGEIEKGRELDIWRINKTGTPGIIKNASDPYYLLSIDDYWLPKDKDGLEEIKASEYK